ncbi:hypothetical protein CEUSTIGMA_g11180.t1 [Chlamydomonas eustigma]|uniref:shikimate kinase n=1 Tax=Chlamydomonas eustigma TaxID=1157962 RepID=A0A250XKX7_9CHLO|nr:hypothetical protein CEUSTIGMA_g11180.t1 [Chlamydomonas eustigma]|eukprot:GAX83755.1 hypothetical protein CEUSTIGMA_g11180.t1 [Chlamydomonas eustigma]
MKSLTLDRSASKPSVRGGRLNFQPAAALIRCANVTPVFKTGHVKKSANVHNARFEKHFRVRCQPAQQTSEDAVLEEDFDLLGTKISELVTDLNEELKGCSIYIVGMMGSGKSTLGKMLANTLKYTSFDSDMMIEMTHEKKAVSTIFKEFGEDYFRDCESQVLKQLAPYKNLVVSTGGGAVCRPMNWSYMQQGIVVWLQGSPELLARRVAKDGLEKRPLLAVESSGDDLYGTALSKITSLLEDRTKYYENADVVVNLESLSQKDTEAGAPTAVVMYRTLLGVKAKIQATKEEREAKRNFTIENADQLKTMRTIQSPAQNE